MARLDSDYHRQRARAELDMAWEAACDTAALAHRRLSSLHMERVKKMAGGHGEFDLERRERR